MILLDEHGELVHDEQTPPSEAIKNSLVKCNIMCAYADETTLYRINNRGDLFLVYLSRPKFHRATITVGEREFFKRERRLATDQLVIRDVGCGKSCIYLDTFCFTIPTELLLQ